MEFTVKSHNIESTLGQKFYLCFRLPMKCGLFYVRKRKISLYLQCPLQLAPTPPQVIPQVSLPEQPPSQDNASVQVFILKLIILHAYQQVIQRKFFCVGTVIICSKRNIILAFISVIIDIAHPPLYTSFSDLYCNQSFI